MKKLLACLMSVGILSLAPGQAATAHAATYLGDWRMTVHQMRDDVDYCDAGVCGVSFDIRTNQPGWEGSDQYLVNLTLDGRSQSDAGAGQSYYWHVDPDFVGVRASASTPTLTVGAHTLQLDWLYRGVWTCGPGVPNGCSWVGRQSVSRTYKFRWYGGADQTVRPFVTPASSVSAAAKRVNRKVTVSGVVRAQRLTANFVPTSSYYRVRGARATLQSYSPQKRKWISRTTRTSNATGVVSRSLTASRVATWRWVVAPRSIYHGSKSRAIRK